MNLNHYDNDDTNVFHVPFYRKKKFIIGAAVAAVGVVAIGAGVGAAGGGSPYASFSSSEPQLPTVEVPITEFEENKIKLGNSLIERYNSRGIDFADLYVDDSPAGKALTYVAGSSVYSSLDETRRMQRFVLATFYYGTFGVHHAFIGEENVAPGWNSSTNWISSAAECLWEGITCDEDDHITQIQLPDNSLSGSIPKELGLLHHLVYVDLHTNLIMGQGSTNDVWNFMPQLEELTMDDNFIVGLAGIPEQMAKLVSLQKLSLSYNLLQGTIDGTIFNGLTQLTHLEIESNYLEGPIPQEVASLPNLVYLYVRRNALVFPLESLIQEGNLPSIFALWLDGNTVSGTIPAAIGTLTDLNSFSVTNCTLTGRLPTELGSLADMKRIWLYNNQLVGPIPSELAAWTDLQVMEVHDNALTGTMPQPVCDAVGRAEYQFKTLSADCDEVSCACCTQCF